MSVQELPQNMRFKRITDATAHAYLSSVTGVNEAYTSVMFAQFGDRFKFCVNSKN